MRPGHVSLQVHAASLNVLLEVEAEFSGQRARRDVMRAAERGQEIVEGFLVGYVDYREAQTPLVAVAVEKVVVSNGGVKQAPRVNAWRVVVIILRPGRGYFYQRRAELRREARKRQTYGGRGMNGSTVEPGLKLLIGGEWISEGIRHIDGWLPT